MNVICELQIDDLVKLLCVILDLSFAIPVMLVFIQDIKS